MYRGIIAIATVIIAIIAWVTALGIPAFFSWKKQKYFLINILKTIILTSLLFFYPIRYFSKTVIEMWNRQTDPGYVSFSDYGRLGGIHILFILMFIILVITLLVRLFSRFSRANGFLVLSSVIFLICINISFFYSYPRYGDEGVEGLLYTLVAFFFADLILIITIFIFAISSIIKHSLKKKKFIESLSVSHEE